MKNILFTLALLVSFNSFGQITIETKYNPPEGYERVYNDDYSKFLRKFPLKKDNIVKLYDGTNKDNYSFEYNTEIWDAVFDYDIGKKDLHQCADAVLYMRANYLHTKGLTDKLHYTFLSGYEANYLDFITHYYIVNGSTVSLASRNNALIDNLETFGKWIEKIWMWSNTESIDTYDSFSVAIKDIRPGDFFIQSNPGSFGHAINVVDVVVNSITKKKKFMLSQSYMPAQETHILINPENGGVWYTLDEYKDIETPEWTFTVNQLKRFKH